MWLAGTVQNPVYGSWTGAKDAVSDGASAVMDKVGGYATDAWHFVTGGSAAPWESIAGTAGDTAVEAGTGNVATANATGDLGGSVISETIQKLTDKLAAWVYNTFGETATNMIFSGTSSATASEIVSGSENGAVSLGGTVGNVLGPVMWAYTAYCREAF